MRLALLRCGVLAVSLLAGCDDDEGGPGGALDAGDEDAAVPDSGIDASQPDASASKRIGLKFAARFGATALACGQDYPKQGTTGVTVTPKDFRFYVQSVTLRATNGQDVPLVFDDLASADYQTRDVALVDFTTTGGECEGGPTTSNTSILGTVPANLDFTAVHLVIGVPETLNHGNPSVAPAPLQAPGASWDWTAGYRFFIAEVLASELGDAGAPGLMDAGADAGAHGSTRAGGLFHLGSTGCTKSGTEYTCNNPNRAELSLSNFDPTRDTIVADLAAVFAKADLSGSVQCHGGGPGCAPMFESLGVDLATGAALSLQSVFSVSR